MNMITVQIGDQERHMTPKDALALAYRIIMQAAEAVPREDENAPHLGDFVLNRPAVRIRTEPNEDEGGLSVAIVAKGAAGPSAWLWFNEQEAIELGRSLITMASPAAGGSQ